MKFAIPYGSATKIKYVIDHRTLYELSPYSALSRGFGLLARSSATAWMHSLEQNTQFLDILNLFPKSPVLHE